MKKRFNIISWIVAIVAIAVLCLTAVGCGDTTTTNDQSQNQSNKTEGTKDVEWFSTQFRLIHEAELGLEAAKEKERETYQSFFGSRCASIENPTGGPPCKERWETDGVGKKLINDIGVLEARVNTLIRDYNTEASKVPAGMLLDAGLKTQVSVEGSKSEVS